MAKTIPTPYETVLVVYDDGKVKRKTVQYSALPVKLPGHDNDLYLVVVKGFGQKPMMLLTSCAVITIDNRHLEFENVRDF